MWNLHCRLICRRRLNPASRCNPSKMIMPFSGDANAVKTASIVGVFRDTKTKTIHFSVNGNDQGVALQNIPRSIHGFLRLRSQGGKICATLMPDHREAEKLIFPGFRTPCSVIMDFLHRRARRRQRAIAREETGSEVTSFGLEAPAQSPPVTVPRSSPVKTTAPFNSSPVPLIPDVPQLRHYEMTKRPRGICLIINNLHFENSMTRDGADRDEKALKDLFGELFFTVHVKRDLQKHEIEKIAADYAAGDHSNFNIFVFIVMSHGGDRDVVYGVRGRKTRLEDLMVEFTAPNCPTLQSKPKLFFSQSCRGSQANANFSSFDSAKSTQFTISSDSDAISYSSDSTIPRSIVPPGADFLLACATSPGYVAWRRPGSGSLFIQAFVDVVKTYHTYFHLLDLLTEVNRCVVEEQNNMNLDADQICQVPAPTHTLTAQVFL